MIDLKELKGYVDTHIELRMFFDELEFVHQRSSLDTFDKLFYNANDQQDIMSFYSKYKNIIYSIERLTEEEYIKLYSYFLLDDLSDISIVKKIIIKIEKQKRN